MIVIKAIQNNGVVAPERMLKSEEQLTITSSLCNGVDYIFYQGDEPIIINENEN